MWTCSLVVGSVQGQLRKAFDKISKLHSKQSFTLALVVGDLFGTGTDEQEVKELEALLNGSLSIPLPVYFTVGESELPETVRKKLDSGEDVCPNLTYLGRKGTFTTVEGVRIVFLGGRLVQNQGSVTQALGPYDPLYLEPDARGLHGAHSAHILLTNQWPANITNGSAIDVPEGVDQSSGTQAISGLCSALTPWYHFSSSPEAVWEREPFKHVADHQAREEQPPVTRFKSLPSVAAPSKDWMTAFTLNTSRPPPTLDAPRDSPFIKTSPRKRYADEQQDSSSSRYGRGESGEYSRRPNKRSRKDPNDCYMCLNKPGFKTHMVVSIGDESMVTVLRGPLPLPSTFPQLSFSGHVMIIPHYHAADEVAQGMRPPEEVAAEFAEMNKFRNALSQMIGSKSAGNLGAVCWEVNRTGIRHHHWQLMAVEAEQIRKGVVDAAFKVSRERNEYAVFQTCDPDGQPPQKSDYFRFWTWAPTTDPVQMPAQINGREQRDEGVTKSMYLPLSPDQKFNIWFGREVMAGLLQLENRVNWMNSLLRSEDEEQAAEVEDAEGLKADFKEFDFAMQ